MGSIPPASTLFSSSYYVFAAPLPSNSRTSPTGAGSSRTCTALCFVSGLGWAKDSAFIVKRYGLPEGLEKKHAGVAPLLDQTLR
jgi:hypothetical protein